MPLLTHNEVVFLKEVIDGQFGRTRLVQLQQRHQQEAEGGDGEVASHASHHGDNGKGKELPGRGRWDWGEIFSKI